MSTLKVNKLRDTAGSADAITLDPNGGAVLAGVTTVTSVKVGAAVTISESGIEASGIGITCASINGTQIGGRRNLIINGAMLVAQRGTSSTTSGYSTVDRYSNQHTGTDEAPTYAQVDVASGTTPYTLGFRKAVKITNGNQTSGAGGTDLVVVKQIIEAQNVAQSGWNYNSTSGYITLSFWVKSSVAQAFSGNLRTSDGTAYVYKYDTPTLSADTWTKVTKTIPGNSNLTFTNDNGEGLVFHLYPFIGTDYTTSNSDTETWITASSANYANDMTSTWWTTNDATCEVTGLQLEVGSQATPFEHRSFGEELILCQRYYQQYVNPCCTGVIPDNGSKAYSIGLQFQTRMRAVPTLTITNAGTGGNVSDGQSTQFISALNAADRNVDGASIYLNLAGDLGDFRPACLGLNDSTTNSTTYKFTAEL